MRSLHEMRLGESVKKVVIESNNSDRVRTSAVRPVSNDDRPTEAFVTKKKGDERILAQRSSSSQEEDADAFISPEAIHRAMRQSKKEEGLKAKGEEFQQLRDELLKSRRATTALTSGEAVAAVRTYN